MLQVRQPQMSCLTFLFLSRTAAGGWATVLHQLADLLIALEPFLGLYNNVMQNRGIYFPICKSFVICAATLIIDNERVYPKPQAFLHHNQSSDSTIIIVKGTNVQKAHMKV